MLLWLPTTLLYISPLLGFLWGPLSIVSDSSTNASAAPAANSVNLIVDLDKWQAKVETW